MGVVAGVVLVSAGRPAPPSASAASRGKFSYLVENDLQPV